MPRTPEPTKTKIQRKAKSPAPTDLSSLLFGKIPPQAKDLEEAVLGAIMLEKDALTAVIDILKPESFYVDSHQKIYKGILNLFEKSQPVDILTVTEQLKQAGELDDVGGPFYVTQLTDRVASAANVEYHARIISQKYIQRELIQISTKIINDAYEDTTDVFELLDRAEQNLFTITDQNLKRSSESMQTLIKRSIEQIESLKDRKDGLTGIPSGFTELDRLTSGWQKSDLIIVAARPGMGKTAFAISLARNAAVDSEHPVAIFSMEMSSIQLVNRLISQETELPVEKLRRGNLAMHEWQQLNTKVENLLKTPILIDDTPALNIFELRAKCRRMKTQHNVQLFIIDYLQLMSGAGVESKSGNREQEISHISRSLKSIAKELDTPVLAISQLSRAVETRGGPKRPQLSDLRESGAIEQDADVVAFIYRPEYYQINEDEEGNSLKGIGEIIIAKHRNGALKTILMKFIDKYAKFMDLDNQDLSMYGAPEHGPESETITRSSKLNDIEDDGSPF